MLKKVRRVPVGLFPSRSSRILRGRLLTVKRAPNAQGFRRFGVIVSKAVVQSAARRNRLKRFVYRILAGISEKPAEDVIVILNPPALAADAAKLKEELLSLIGP